MIRGDQRGRELGYPTANMSIAGLHPPKFGVYAVEADVLTGPHAGRHAAVASAQRFAARRSAAVWFHAVDRRLRTGTTPRWPHAISLYRSHTSWADGVFHAILAADLEPAPGGESLLQAEPVPRRSLLRLLEDWQPIDTDWPEVRDPV